MWTKPFIVSAFVPFHLFPPPFTLNLSIYIRIYVHYYWLVPVGWNPPRQKETQEFLKGEIQLSYTRAGLFFGRPVLYTRLASSGSNNNISPCPARDRRDDIVALDMCCVRNTLLDELLNQFDAPMRVRMGGRRRECRWEFPGKIRENAPSHGEEEETKGVA